MCGQKDRKDSKSSRKQSESLSYIFADVWNFLGYSKRITLACFSWWWRGFTAFLQRTQWSLLHANLGVTSNNNRHSRNCLCLHVCFTWKRYLRSQKRSDVHSTQTFECTFLYGLNLIIKPMPLQWLASYTNYVPNTQWSLIERLYNNGKTKGIHRWIFVNKAGTSSYMNQFERLIDLKS